jgi:DMSO/TMAO reductase YedYZ molybdopterin-dependent catalytic subunit
MFTDKSLCLCILLITILSILGLVLSCSQPFPNINTETFTANQTAIPSETQISSTSNDLSYLVNSDPAKVDNSTLPITPIDQIHVTGVAPEIDISKYRLIVNGLVSTPLSLTYDAIMQYPTVTEVVLLICPGVFADNAQWTGVPVTTILAEAGVEPQAKEVTF